MRQNLRILACIAALVSSLTASAELRIEIVGGSQRPIPVAIVPFGWQGSGASAPMDVAGIVARDLSNTGRFEALAEKDMLQRPTTGADVDLKAWKMVGVEAVVVGRLLETAPGEFAIQFQLFDVLRGEQLLGFRLPSAAAALRLSSHRVADMIYEKLTGVPGIFTTRIAYVTATKRNGAELYRLIVADADGENEQIMVESKEPIMSPSWSPDGRRLAYVSFENKSAEIYVQTLRSGGRQKVSSRAGVNGAPAWSPDGRMLALTLSRGEGNLDIFILDLTSQVLTRLTDQRSIETEASWSPDGRSIFFTSDRAGAPQIYRAPASPSPGGNAQRVTFEGNYNARPRLSPDGKRMAVVTNDRGNYRIALVDLEHGFTQVLTDGRQDESPSFAPNGETLIYATRESGRGVLATVSADGRIRQRIPAVEGDVREPAWSPFRTN